MKDNNIENSHPLMWSSSDNARRRKKNDSTTAMATADVVDAPPSHSHVTKKKTSDGKFIFVRFVVPAMIVTTGIVIWSPAAIFNARSRRGGSAKNQSSGGFSFEHLWNDAGLPKITKIEIVDGSDPSFDINEIYEFEGKTLPRIIRGTTDPSSFPPHTKWNGDDGSSGKGFLYNQFLNDPDFASIVMHDGLVYMRGTDAWEGTNPKLTLVSGNDGVEWQFGETLTRDENSDKKAYVGLKDLRKFPEIMTDLEGLPKFMVKDDGHRVPFENHHQTIALWAGTGGNVNSGLHYDMNNGGFMYLVKGRKQILMFPQSDNQNLYMRTEDFHIMESSLHIGQILEERQRNDKLLFVMQYKKLWDTKPYLAEMEEGDVMYIPHEWFHEVYTEGDSIGISTWVTQAG